MRTPKALKKGDRIGLISTARKISKKELKPAIDLFKDWGLKAETATHLFEVYDQFSGTDEQRLADLQGFIDRADIKAIICVKGGYGTVRIIDELNFFALVENPKWIAGYSDVTVLLNKLTRAGIECLHAPMPAGFKDNTENSIKSLKQALFGKSPEIKIKAHPLNKTGECKGRLIGGNLSVIYSQLGSASSLNTEGNIIFLEDLDEYLYHIDRMMMNLKRNNYFEKAAGVIVGSMTDMNDNKVPFGESAEEIIARILKPYNFPVCFGFPAGHMADNNTLIMGRRAYLKVGNSVSLKFEDGGT